MLEFIGGEIKPEHLSLFKKTDKVRFYFNERNNMNATNNPHELIPLKISRSTARMEEVK